MNTHHSPNPMRRERLLNLAATRRATSEIPAEEPVSLPEMLIETEASPVSLDEPDMG